VLIGKLEIIIFKEAIHEDDEFAHAGGHGDEGVLQLAAQKTRFLSPSAKK